MKEFNKWNADNYLPNETIIDIRVQKGRNDGWKAALEWFKEIIQIAPEFRNFTVSDIKQIKEYINRELEELED